MKQFRALVITKKHLKRGAAVILSAVLCTGLCLGIRNREPQSEAVFADARDILDEGIPQADKPSGIKKALKLILGMDTDDPKSIINESSSMIEAAAEHTPPSAAPAENTEPPAETTAPEDSDTLPSHDEIMAAAEPEYKNATSYNIDIPALSAAPLETKLSGSGEPEVLIMHTHTTECYSGDAMSGEGERTTNEAYNMCAVGDVLADRLESHGIHVMHDKTIHDYPSYQSSYTRALNTITADIKNNPEIKVVIDLHRDAFIYADGTKLRVAADIDGTTAAQAMLVLGTDSMGLYHPYWQSNLSLALKIQKASEIMYPGLMRPIDIRRERFNMHATKGSILIEVGSNGNTLAEAKLAAGYLGDAIAAALLNG